MYCYKCGENVEEVGGTQLTDCYHFLCLECLQTAVEETNVLGVQCEVKRGFYRCQGYISHEELECMVSEEAFGKYLERLSNSVDDNDDTYPEAVGATGYSYGESKPGKLNLSDEDKEYGWAHKLLLVDELIQRKGLSPEKAEAHLEKLAVLETQATTSCAICMDDEVAAGDGIVLKDCFHMFCKGCLASLVEHNDEPDVKCPYIDGNYSCVYHLQQREIKGIVSQQVYEQYLQKSLRFGESRMENTFHCKTPDCLGWCEYDQGVTRFDCPLCSKPNCIKCQVIHDGSCEDYQNKIVQNTNDKMSEAALEELIRRGEYMRCPKCKIPVQKVDRCDWLQCTCCKTEICWATRGPRWGPKGHGDTSGGCKCKLNGALCHPKCGNCH